MRWPRPLAGVLAVAAVTGCGAGSGLDALGVPLHRPVSQRELAGLPEARLLYPGSVVRRHVGADEHAQPGAAEPDPAYVGTVAVAPATPQRLHAWYDRQLTRRGFRAAPFYRASDQLQGWAWTAPDRIEQVQVALTAAGPVPAASPPGGSTYEVFVVDYRATGPPPPPPRSTGTR